MNDHHNAPSQALPPARLTRLAPAESEWHAHTIRELPSNGAGVDYVRHHALTSRQTDTSWNVVEKSLRKPLLYRSREARFYRHYAMLTTCRRIAYPALLGVTETPRRSSIYSEYIAGKRPVREKLLHDAAGGIAELEAVSARYIAAGTASARLDFWLMDFFRWPYLRHTRLNFQRFLVNLEIPEIASETRERLLPPLKALGPRLKARLRAAKETPRCVCHLDYAAKNMLVDGDRLYLLDWSEVKIGRIGFDGADLLAKLFVHTPLSRFDDVRRRFEQDYDQALAEDYGAHHLVATAAFNRQTLFTLLSLWRCLQQQTIRTHVEAGTLDVLVARLDYLLDACTRGASAVENDSATETQSSAPIAVTALSK
ncbi:phosphotransferase [Salinicola halophilus]|uniref:phosphotransferase n=1 Tax=Salinicola halophilus TaxID=184065 RepID=UPI000DA21145|nr:phosphotransferase [Salinicola halophilus]